MNFKEQIKPHNLKNLYAIFDGSESSWCFWNQNSSNKIEDRSLSDKVSDHAHLKISTAKQMLQRLPIALAQKKDGNISENLLNEMRQIIYSLYRAKEITKKSI